MQGRCQRQQLAGGGPDAVQVTGDAGPVEARQRPPGSEPDPPVAGNSGLMQLHEPEIGVGPGQVVDFEPASGGDHGELRVFLDQFRW